jgi:hypothetical protein
MQKTQAEPSQEEQIDPFSIKLSKVPLEAPDGEIIMYFKEQFQADIDSVYTLSAKSYKIQRVTFKDAAMVKQLLTQRTVTFKNNILLTIEHFKI